MASAEVVALDGVDLAVSEGDFVAVLGPSGSGKTTLLNCLSGLDSIESGEVLLEGRDIQQMRDAERTRHRATTMGFVFQAFNLVPVFSAVENVELPLLLAGVGDSEARRRATEALERMDLGAASATARRRCPVGSSSGSRSPGPSSAVRD